MNIEDKKKRIIELIDDSREDGRKIAFYSDPRVSNILMKLYEEWEKNGKKGIPIDYADDEEIEILYNLAIRYSKVSGREAWAIYLRNIYGLEKSSEEKKKSRLKGFLRFP